MALTHAQMTALMLGVVERFGVPEEGIVGMLPGLDIAAVEKDLNDALQAIYRVLTPTRSGTHAQDMPNSVSVTSTSTLPAIPTHLLHPLDNSQFRRASPQLAHFRATVLRHSQTLVNAAMHRDLLTLFFPLAMQYIDRVPTFEDPRRNRGVMGVYKRIAGHAKWAVGRCVEEILARGQGGRRGSSASETSNASLNSGFSVETVLEVERKEVRWNVEEVVGVLEKTERIVKGCRWFWEVAEFRALVEAGESGRGRVLEEVEEGWDEVRIEEVEETVEKVEKVQKLVKGNEVLKVVDTLKEGKEGKEGFRGGWRYGGIEGSGKKTMRARINSAPGWIDARTF
ncbi:hypothetical protein BC829DRAFT_210356 [Chytridium lagenaria]|nr:hypothetical protein BC829DRAFT_210356 [Chytridium lagenaria]